MALKHKVYLGLFRDLIMAGSLYKPIMNTLSCDDL